MEKRFGCTGFWYSLPVLLVISHASSHGVGEGRFLWRNDMELERHLKRINKPAVKTIKSTDGDFIDCVDMYKQPAFDHPSMRNHTIQVSAMLFFFFHIKPSSFPNGMKEESSHFQISQPWHKKGSCPEGTIPIRRTQKQDLLRASSLTSYGKKYAAYQPNFAHEHSLAYVNNGKYYGAKAIINVWNPNVEKNKLSLSQIWILSDQQGTAPDDLTTVEAGWMVQPILFGDNQTRLFAYWTKDRYQSTGCYNLLCPGFVQINNSLALGGIIEPTSTYDSDQFEIDICLFKDVKSGNWWFQVHDTPLGYWPSSLLTRLADSSPYIGWGGEIFNSRPKGHHTTTQMGSGHFSVEGYKKSSFFRNIKTVDDFNQFTNLVSIQEIVETPTCYDIQMGENSTSDWEYFFYYGGSGQSPNCS
ncbi:protein neprosin-like [Tasmannia lanceolata]|uniref:protein neprosin-like n=1 Tax=Tasmannia lanceolata TaxID=3420 RepID=UPI004064C852